MLSRDQMRYVYKNTSINLNGALFFLFCLFKQSCIYKDKNKQKAVYFMG